MIDIELSKSLDSIEKNIGDVKKELDEGKTTAKAYQEEIKRLGDEQLKLAKAIEDVTQSVDKSVAEHKDVNKSLGQLAYEAGDLKSYEAGTKLFEVSKAVATSGAANSIERTTLTPAYQAGMVTMPERELFLENLFPHISVSTDAIEYLKEGGVTDGSKVTKEGTKLGESTITKPTLHTANCVNIGAYATVTHQLITNEGAFSAYINEKLQYKLQANIENQLINGVGGATELSGLLTEGNYTDKVADIQAKLKTGATMFDFALLLKTAFTSQNIVPEALILNPEDWTELCLLKDTKGYYLLGGPQSIASQQLWGVKVITTPLVNKGKFILGNFRLGATIYDREALQFRISDQDGENFKSQLFTLRVTRRLGFAVENPLAIFGGNWATTSAGA